MNKKVAFLHAHTRGHLSLNPALGEGLSEAPTEAAIHEYRLHLVEQLVASGEGVPALSRRASIMASKSC